MTAVDPSSELRRALDRLEGGDPARLLVEMALQEDGPELWAAVLKRLLQEIRVARGGPPVTSLGEIREAGEAHA